MHDRVKKTSNSFMILANDKPKRHTNPFNLYNFGEKNQFNVGGSKFGGNRPIFTRYFNIFPVSIVSTMTAIIFIFEWQREHTSGSSL